MFIGIDQFLWLSGEAGGYWEAAPGCEGLIDLAGYEQIVAARPGRPRGWLIGQWKEQPEGFVERGGIVLAGEDVRDARPDGKARDAIQSVLGYLPEGDTLKDWIVSLLTIGADPLQSAGPGLLVPTHTRRLEVWLAGSKIDDRQFDPATDPYWPKLKNLLKRQLNALREASLDGKLIDPTTKQVNPEYHLKIADAMVEKYAGFDVRAKSDLWLDLKPVEWDAHEEPTKHATTITDNFNRSNGALGSSAEGWSWTNTIGNGHTISSNAALSGSNLAMKASRAEQDLSSGDHYGQVKVTNSTTSRDPGPIVRHDSTDDTFYGLAAYSNNENISKVVTATPTTLTSKTSTFANGDTLKISISGSTLESFINGVSIDSRTDTAIDNTRLRSGIWSRLANANTAMDDFVAADLSSAGAGSIFGGRAFGKGRILGGSAFR